MEMLYGLIGEKLGHSFSPIIHSLLFEKMNIKAHYHLFEVDRENLKYIISALKVLNIKGVNMTIPYKVDIIKYLDGLSNEAKNIGSVNTICIEDGKAKGYNTDYYGFGMMLDREGIELKDEIVVILGTGGVSRAVFHYAMDHGAKDVIFISREPKCLKSGFRALNVVGYKDIKYLKDKSIVVNCTPIGMYPNLNFSPLSREDISQFQVAIDLIYNPWETLFLRYGREEGLKTVNGLYMLVGQGIKSEELWNDVRVEYKIIDDIYDTIRGEYM